MCRKGESLFWLVAQVLESDCLDINSNSIISSLDFLDLTSLNFNSLFCQTGLTGTHEVNLRMNMNIKHVE